MKILISFMFCLAFTFAAGFAYRISALLFCLLFSYLYFLEMSLYLNHFYLVVLVCFLLIFVPANQTFSVDSWLWNKFFSSSSSSSSSTTINQRDSRSKTTVPYWSIWIFQVLIAIVYFYAGVAKINEDWLRGEPLLHWFPKRADKYPWFGKMLIYCFIYLLCNYFILFIFSILFKCSLVCDFL